MGMTRRIGVRQSDVRRMMRAVQAEGFNPRSIRVEVSGDVSIDIGDGFEVQVDPLDAWRDRRGSAVPRH